MLKLNSNSRYLIGGYTDKTGAELGYWERFAFKPSVDDFKFTITRQFQYRPDLVAYTVYGSTSMMWFVLQFNNILDIDKEFGEGVIISLPTPRRVQTSLLR